MSSRLAALRARLRPPRRTIRLRLTVTYFLLFVISAAGLLALTIVLWHAVSGTAITSGASGGRRGHISPGTAGRPIGFSIQDNADLHHLIIAAAIALAVFAAIAIGLGWFAAGRFLRPVRRITTTAKNVSASNLHERLNLPGPHDEMKELGDTFDDLLARLERSFASERQFVANAAHELRTPNATMRVWLDVAMAKPEPVPPHISELARRLRAELGNVGRTLDGLLALAYYQNGPLTDQRAVSLSAVTMTALERHAEAIAARGLKIEHQLDHRAWATGNATLLSRVIDNLVDNAVKHNEPGGWVHITSTQTDQSICLVVENGGPCLEQHEVHELVRPFRRLGAERTGSEQGSGLGLSIVAAVIDVHGGILNLDARPEGGLRVKIALPPSAPTAGAPVH
jgi:signal transduction histidine kinase